ncbi:MAG: hypothetical protein M1130_08370 [Actinobacteria bacterium]|nr:hypothetical protein [Actinomycetota bacterium]
MKELEHNEIINIISQSGYFTEQKTVIEFEKQGFFTGPNYAFEDQDEHKSREIDFIASKYVDFEFGKTGFYYLIYGEVKRKTNPLVFFEKVPHHEESLEVYIPVIASKSHFPYISPGLDIKRILDFNKNHHQSASDKISTQFCEIDVQKKKAGHKTLYESLFLPLIKCVDHEYTSIEQTFSSTFNPKNPSFFVHVLNPVLIVSGPIYAYDIYTNSLTKKDYVLYRRHYKSNTIKRTLLIDIVSADKLAIYVSDKLKETFDSLASILLLLTHNDRK